MAAIDIEVGCRDGRIDPVRVRARTPNPARALHGLSPPAVAGVLGRLYAVCGVAQRACAELALAAAAGVALAPEREERLARALAAEAIQEHLWRLWLDWPATLGLAPAREPFTHVYGCIQCGAPAWPAELASLLDVEWLGVAASRLAGFERLASFDSWCAAPTTPAARLFAALAREPAARPAATALAPASQAAHPWVAALLAAHRALEAQLAARVVGLVGLVAALATDHAPDVSLQAQSLEAGHGRAAVSTARGTLEHEARLANGHVDSYAIRTPTDRHFAPSGPLVACLLRRPAADADDARRSASLWALALDPCVTFAVTTLEADHA